MGLGVSKDVALGAKYLLETYTGRLVLDADGLNSLAIYEKENIEKLFANKKCDVVLTPHAKEFSRLLNVTVEEILQGGLQIAKAFAKKNNVTLLLKGATSIITNGEKCFLFFFSLRDNDIHRHCEKSDNVYCSAYFLNCRSRIFKSNRSFFSSVEDNSYTVIKTISAFELRAIVKRCGIAFIHNKRNI